MFSPDAVTSRETFPAIFRSRSFLYATCCWYSPPLRLQRVFFSVRCLRCTSRLWVPILRPRFCPYCSRFPRSACKGCNARQTVFECYRRILWNKNSSWIKYNFFFFISSNYSKSRYTVHFICMNTILTFDNVNTYINIVDSKTNTIL